MTDNEIIKALERCGQHRECCYCNSVEECGNKRVLTASTLDLINHKNAELESLKNKIKYKNQHIANLRELGKKIKSEAIKEFAKRLKIEAFECDVSFGYGKECYQQAVAVIEIDNLVKEMTEDENENH